MLRARAEHTHRQLLVLVIVVRLGLAQKVVLVGSTALTPDREVTLCFLLHCLLQIVSIFEPFLDLVFEHALLVEDALEGGRFGEFALDSLLDALLHQQLLLKVVPLDLLRLFEVLILEVLHELGRTLADV